MAGQERHMEGNADQKRQAAREAREQGKQPSEVGATTGASKQRERAPNNASHQERMELEHEGKQQQQDTRRETPRPGNRETDPGRDDREAPFE